MFSIVEVVGSIPGTKIPLIQEIAICLFIRNWKTLVIKIYCEKLFVSKQIRGVTICTLS